MIEKKTWNEFRGTGLFLFINQFLHIFGWAIVLEMDGDDVKTIYPAKVGWTGFGEESTDKAYRNIRKYMAENSKELLNKIIK